MSSCSRKQPIGYTPSHGQVTTNDSVAIGYELDQVSLRSLEESLSSVIAQNCARTNREHKNREYKAGEESIRQRSSSTTQTSEHRE